MKKNEKNPKTPKSIEDFALKKLGIIIRREREKREDEKQLLFITTTPQKLERI